MLRGLLSVWDANEDEIAELSLVRPFWQALTSALLFILLYSLVIEMQSTQKWIYLPAISLFLQSGERMA